MEDLKAYGEFRAYPPPLAPQKHLGTQRDLWDDRRSWNVKRRIEGEVVVKGEGAPPRRWGGARRSEAASANLIWWECIHAEEQEIPAGRQHWSAKTLRWRDREIGGGGWPMVCDFWSGENCSALVDTLIHWERQRGNRKWCNRFRDTPLHPRHLLSPPPDRTAGVTPALLSLSTPPSRLSTRCN